LSYEEHDMVTANTQAVTHAAFLRYVAHSHHGEVWIGMRYAARIERGGRDVNVTTCREGSGR
jgi:prephenate dehydrogenase